MTPENFSYRRVPDEDCVGDYYIVRTDTRNDTEERVAYSGITDTDSTYVLKTINEEEDTKEYWDFGTGWDHLDDLLYNAAFHIFRAFDNDQYFEIIVNLGRIKNITQISTETYEQSISLFVPEDHSELDVPGLAGEESITGDAEPVMFNAIDVLEELYWVVREFSEVHSNFQDFLDEKSESHSLQSDESFRTYQALALAYPFFEGLVGQLVDRVELKEQPFGGNSGIQFRYLKSNTPRDNTKNLIIILHESHGVLTEYEREFLIDTFYNESIDVGIARNDLAHNIFDATRGFQNVDWRELARRMIVSIAFLDEKVVCSYSNWTDASDLRKFERWLAEREREGFVNLQNSG